jgi:predicted dinucleotide-binding enzyme
MPVARIAVMGYGRIGGTLARRWVAAGHDVTVGARDADKQEVRDFAADAGARVASIADAVAGSDILAFAIPGSAMDETMADLGVALEGKLVIDAANNVRAPVMHNAAAVSAAAPGARYARAFASLGWEMLESAEAGGVKADMFFCCPEADRAVMEGLVADVGLRPIWVGGSEEVDVIDGVLRLWLTLVMKRGHPRRLAINMVEG